MLISDKGAKGVLKKAIEGEIKSILRHGVSRGIQDQSSIIQDIIDSRRAAGEKDLTIGVFLKGQADQLDVVPREAFLAWLSIDQPATAQRRREGAAEKAGVSISNFDKSWAPKILKRISELIEADYHRVSRIRILRETFGDNEGLLQEISNTPDPHLRLISKSPEKIRVGFDYDVRLDLDSGNITTQYHSYRTLPKQRPLSLYICQSNRALAEAQADPALIGFEVCHVPERSWHAMAPNMKVESQVDGKRLRLAGDPLIENDFVKFNFEDFDHKPGQFQSVDVSTAYWTDPARNRYSIKLRDRVAIGGLRMTFTILSAPEVIRLSGADYIAGLSDALSPIIPRVDSRVRAAVEGQPREVSLELTCGSPSVVWPGSGFELYWTRSDLE